MSSLMSRQKEIEKNKRYLFLGASSAGLLSTLFWTPFFGIPLLGLGAYWGYKWFNFRAKNGMRF